MSKLKPMKSKSTERRVFYDMTFYVFSIEALQKTIDEQSQQLKDLNEKTASLSSQLASQAEIIKQK